MVSGEIKPAPETIINRVLLVLLGLLFLGTPIIVLRPVYNAAIETKFFYSEIFILLITGVWILKTLFTGKTIPLRGHPLNLPILCFILYILIRNIMSPLPRAAFNDSFPLLCWLFLTLVIIQYVQTEFQRNLLLVCILIGALLTALHGIGQYFGWELKYLEWKGKPKIGNYIVIGTLGNANFIAEYLMPIFLLISCFFLLGGNKKWQLVLGVISFVIIGTCFWLTGANEIWIIFLFLFPIVLLAFLLVFRKEGLKNIFKSSWRWIVSGLAVLLLLCITISPLTGNWVLLKNQPKLLLQEQTYSERFMVWEIACKMIVDKPIFGWGTGQFRIQYFPQLAEFLRNPDNNTFIASVISTKGSNANQAHNDYLQLSAELGILGTAIFLWILVIFYWTQIKLIIRATDKSTRIQLLGFILSITSILLDGVCNFPFHLPVSGLLFWSLVGLSISYTPRPDPSPNLTKSKGYMRIILIIVGIGVIYTFFVTIDRIKGNLALKQGLKQLALKNTNEGDILLQRAIYYDPTLGEAYLRRSNLLLDKNKPNEAMESAFLSFRYGTDDVERYYLLAKSCYLRGEPQRALEILNTTTLLFPQYSDAYKLAFEINNNTLHHPEQALKMLEGYISSGLSEEEEKEAQEQFLKLKLQVIK